MISDPVKDRRPVVTWRFKSVHDAPVPGMPTVDRVPALLIVTCAPRTPTLADTPRLPTLTRTPGMVLIERRKRKAIG